MKTLKKILIKNNLIRDEILKDTNSILMKTFSENGVVKKFYLLMQSIIYSKNLQTEKIIDKFITINCLHIFIRNQFNKLPNEYSLIFENQKNNFILKILKIKNKNKHIVSNETLCNYDDFEKAFNEAISCSVKENDEILSLISSHINLNYGLSLRKIKFRIFLQVFFKYHDDEIRKLMKLFKINQELIG